MLSLLRMPSALAIAPEIAIETETSALFKEPPSHGQPVEFIPREPLTKNIGIKSEETNI